ncbi:MAG: cysteine synthase [Verrucomicrobiales bacterium]|jgi:cysteine synthase
MNTSCAAAVAPIQHHSARFTCDGILDSIGGTPVVRLRRYLDEAKVNLFAKLEAVNPGGSAKDRPASRMITDALQRGEVGRGYTVIEEVGSEARLDGMLDYC